MLFNIEKQLKNGIRLFYVITTILFKDLFLFYIYIYKILNVAKVIKTLIIYIESIFMQ